MGIQLTLWPEFMEAEHRKVQDGKYVTAISGGRIVMKWARIVRSNG